jgi:hypothetical protein
VAVTGSLQSVADRNNLLFVEVVLALSIQEADREKLLEQLAVTPAVGGGLMCLLPPPEQVSTTLLKVTLE